MTINLGVIGAGGFAQFAVKEFIKIPGVHLSGVYDEDSERAYRLHELDKSSKVFTSEKELVIDSTINLVYIATPPFLHYSQSKAALQSGKHVICEKPAALKLSHAEELRAIANQNNLLFVVNLMQRYNPLYEAVKELIHKNALGEFLHGFFENYASDEVLTPQHWFWDETKSGGIFIEHGVHFFDLFAGWLGEGKIISSQKTSRAAHDNIWDQVQATVMYSGGLVNFYHGFHQPKVMDRQEMRLLFERGEITLYEWVPTRLRMTALSDDDNLRVIQSIFANANLEVERWERPQTAQGRFKTIHYTNKLKLDTGDAVQKQTLYQELVTRMFRDQLKWLSDRSHQRRITDDNAVSSLKLAEEAELAAVKIKS